jgi:hypothetical protein
MRDGKCGPPARGLNRSRYKIFSGMQTQCKNAYAVHEHQTKTKKYENNYGTHDDLLMFLYSNVEILLSVVRVLREKVRIKVLVQIFFQDIQSIFFKMQKLNLGQELSIFQDSGDAAADDLDDFLRGITYQGRNHQLHGDSFLLADLVVAQDTHTI